MPRQLFDEFIRRRTPLNADSQIVEMAHAQELGAHGGRIGILAVGSDVDVVQAPIERVWIGECERPGVNDMEPALVFPYVFFFSSRRRHTRSDRDWSSDVCSSD